MSKMIKKSTRKKKWTLETLGMYVWLIPAGALVFFFLILPTFQTVVMSLNQRVEFSENAFTSYVIDDMKNVSGSEVGKSDIFKKVQGWEKVIGDVQTKYKITINPADVDEEMTVKDAVQMMVVAINMSNNANNSGQVFAGLKNYIKMFHDNEVLIALRNNLIWLLFFTSFTVVLGLLIAVLAEKVKWATFAKVIIFLPMAISATASGVIWNFMYFQDVNTGTVNAVINFLNNIHFLSLGHFVGIAFLGRPDLVNVALIVAGVWMQIGFCVVIFSAALKAIPVDLIEMARIEGANNFQIFFKIEVPIIMPTLIVVVTQMIMWVLRVFDIIYTLTKGGPFSSSEVLANRIYMTGFRDNNFEYASAMAVILFIAVIPILIMNIRNLAYEESVRE